MLTLSQKELLDVFAEGELCDAQLEGWRKTVNSLLKGGLIRIKKTEVVRTYVITSKGNKQHGRS